ncbi:MAG: PadR family transcriptional regulator [Peptostreptococcaceae bacterium]|jgi:DNA-binding PadR family transcriptional regulator|nr:PadR family transcriptional regulator [Peptostreptococcaceae bacterium]
MKDKILRKLFLGFIQIHILHHAKKEAIYGSWMIKELNHHGYKISPGTLYPILHTLEEAGLLLKEEKLVEGRIRKYYKITKDGEEVLDLAGKRAYELFHEINENEV